MTSLQKFRFISVCFAALLVLTPTVFAKSESGETGRDRSLQVASSSREVEDRDEDRADDEDRGRDDSQEDANDDNMASTTSRGESESHRSDVAVRVQELLRVADRDGGIGEEVREIAHEYASSTERVEKAKEEVEGRPEWMRVLIGANYRNLGALRSEVVGTESQIRRLEDARSRATSSTTQSDLDAQILALQKEASSTQAYIKEKESGFSLLGWLFRLF